MQTRLPPLHSGTQADRAAHMLRSMAASGIDTAGATGLSGAELERWIDDALDADFEKEFAEFSAERAAAAELALRHGE
jgi:hypothetical protein